jgi:putative FmdB family regulatory protein
MPTYDYRCQACGHALEVFQSITEAAKKKCPKCGKARLERLIGSGAGILFKGGGFYQTDYRSDSYKKAESADKSASAPPSADAGSSKSTEGAPKSESGTSSVSGGEKKPAKQ